MKAGKMDNEEPETLSGVYDDLLESLEETLQWAKGNNDLRTTTLSDDSEIAAREKGREEIQEPALINKGLAVTK